jgi:hypothetical protein
MLGLIKSALLTAIASQLASALTLPIVPVLRVPLSYVSFSLPRRVLVLQCVLLSFLLFRGSLVPPCLLYRWASGWSDHQSTALRSR